MNQNPNPQQSAATALLQLITEHPELPALAWSIGESGHLAGSAFGLADLDAVAAAYREVFGEELAFGSFVSQSDGRRYRVTSFYPVWRDVKFYITLGGGLVEDAQGVDSLPSAWSAAGAA